MKRNIFMDKGTEPLLNMPYYGSQARYYEFFRGIMTSIVGPYKQLTYAETNSGSVANAFAFANEGANVITNDVSRYSYCIADSVMGNGSKGSIEFASSCAALIDVYGYNPPFEYDTNEALVRRQHHYADYLNSIRAKGVRAESINKLDLYEFIRCIDDVDVMFMDFAWPWRDGTATNEYNTTANIFSVGTKTDIWTKDNVIKNVIRAIKHAIHKTKYIVLSNQSSNYPDPEILELSLLDNGIEYIDRFSLTTLADKVDNLGKDKYFVEYAYVIRGSG